MLSTCKTPNMSSPPPQPEETPAQPARAEQFNVPTLAPAASVIPRGQAGRGEGCAGRTFFLWVDRQSAAFFAWLTPGRGCVALQDAQDAGEQGVGDGASDAVVCQVRVRKDGQQPNGLLKIIGGPDLLVGKLLELVQTATNGKLGMRFDHPTNPGSLAPVIPDDYSGSFDVR